MNNKDKGIMEYESTLPVDFDGVFRFTNWSKDEFIGKWGGKEYHFPAETTSPMVIPEHSPLEVQHIRKKFAKDLAEREFFKSKQYEGIRSVEGEKLGGMVQPRLNSIHQANAYTIEELTPFIQRALDSLPIAHAEVKPMQDLPKVENKLTRNDEGEFNTEAVDRKTSLRKKALDA